MFELRYRELEYPCEWPPGEIRFFLPLQRITPDFWRWPERQIRRIISNLTHRRMVKRIDRNITLALSGRPPFGSWPLDPAQLEAAKLVSRLLAEERGLPHHPALHPNDPIPILFWDSFEGLVPIVMSWEFAKKFEIDTSLILRAMAENWTLKRFLSSVVDSGDSNNTN